MSVDSAPPIFTATGICKRYGSVTVLDDVALDIRAGEIHALLGANGAGKSTLCKVISGLVPNDGGTMRLSSAPYSPRNKQDAEAHGIQMVQQEFNQIATLSVAENLMLSAMPSMGGIIRYGELSRRARVALDRFGLDDIEPETVVGTLGVGRQQMVEIATALDRECRLLILDEPTAALSATETRRLFDQLSILRDEGVGILYISHRLDEVAQITDRVTVLRDGQEVGTHATASLTTDQMVDLMSGQDTQAESQFVSQVTSDHAITVRGISGGPIQNVSFTVRRGERLGISGLVGSGRTELLRLIFGADRATAGEVFVGNSSTGQRMTCPRDAVRAGMAMVTEDRKQNGLLLSESIRTNTSLCSLAKLFSWGGLLRRKRERQVAEQMVDTMETRCRDIEQSVATLSGGNQQKVAVSKWLVHDAEVFFFDEPTRGIDVPARRRIYRLFDSLARSGKGIVIVSSDLEELLETCDRILVISAGRMVAEFDRDHWSADDMMQAAFLGYKTTSEPAA